MINNLFEGKQKEKRKRILLIDFSAISNATFQVCLKDPDVSSEEDLIGIWRHNLLNSILVRKKKIEPDEVVLCLDVRNSWRYKYYKYYKSDRKLKRAQSEVDYQFFYDASDKFIKEIRNTFPWLVISNDECEGDDCIGILTHELSKNNDIVILSSDKDLQQLTVYDNIKFYSYRDDEFKPDVDREYLLRHIIIGDKSDSIPGTLTHLRYTKKFKDWVKYKL